MKKLLFIILLILFLYILNIIKSRNENFNPIEIPNINTCTTIDQCDLKKHSRPNLLCTATPFNFYHTYVYFRDSKYPQILELKDNKPYNVLLKGFFDKLRNNNRGNQKNLSNDEYLKEFWKQPYSGGMNSLLKLAKAATKIKDLERLVTQNDLDCNFICREDIKCIARNKHSRSKAGCILLKNDGKTTSDPSKVEGDQVWKSECWQKDFDVLVKLFNWTPDGRCPTNWVSPVSSNENLTADRYVTLCNRAIRELKHISLTTPLLGRGFGQRAQNYSKDLPKGCIVNTHYRPLFPETLTIESTVFNKGLQGK